MYQKVFYHRDGKRTCWFKVAISLGMNLIVRCNESFIARPLGGFETSQNIRVLVLFLNLIDHSLSTRHSYDFPLSSSDVKLLCSFLNLSHASDIPRRTLLCLLELSFRDHVEAAVVTIMIVSVQFITSRHISKGLTASLISQLAFLLCVRARACSYLIYSYVV